MNYLDSLIKLETLRARLRTYGESHEEVNALFIVFQNKASKSKLSFFDIADSYINDLLKGDLDIMKYLE